MTVAEIIAYLQGLSIDPTLWHVTSIERQHASDDPFDGLDFSLGHPELDALWLAGDREEAEAQTRYVREIEELMALKERAEAGHFTDITDMNGTERRRAMWGDALVMKAHDCPAIMSLEVLLLPISSGDDDDDIIDDHPRYLQPVTLRDGRTGTIVMIHDDENYEIDLGQDTETIHERDIADDGA